MRFACTCRPRVHLYANMRGICVANSRAYSLYKCPHGRQAHAKAMRRTSWIILLESGKYGRRSSFVRSEHLVAAGREAHIIISQCGSPRKPCLLTMVSHHRRLANAVPHWPRSHIAYSTRISSTVTACSVQRAGKYGRRSSFVPGIWL